jgi:hypothetical protein
MAADMDEADLMARPYALTREYSASADAMVFICMRLVLKDEAQVRRIDASRIS